MDHYEKAIKLDDGKVPWENRDGLRTYKQLYRCYLKLDKNFKAKKLRRDILDRIEEDESADADNSE